jgi:hypothetical protein
MTTVINTDLNMTTLTIVIDQGATPYDLPIGEVKVSISDPAFDKIWGEGVTKDKSITFNVPINRWLILKVEKNGYNTITKNINIKQPDSTMTVSLEVNPLTSKWIYIVIGSLLLFIIITIKKKGFKLRNFKLRR